MFSAPIAVLMVVALLKMCSVVIAGGLAANDFAQKDAGALRTDVAALDVLNVVEPAKAYFAAGNLAVLDGRLEDADKQFSKALARTAPEESCATRVNLELVRETLGDKAAGVLDVEAALAGYRSALTAVHDAPAGCFAGNADPDQERRVVRDEAAARLNDKIDDLQVPPPPAANPRAATRATATPAARRRIRARRTGCPTAAEPGLGRSAATAATDSAGCGGCAALAGRREMRRHRRFRGDQHVARPPVVQSPGQYAVRIATTQLHEQNLLLDVGRGRRNALRSQRFHRFGQPLDDRRRTPDPGR